MYSYGPPHMAKEKQDDQHEHTLSNYVIIRDIVQKTCQRRWTIGKSGERGSGISVLPARHDDDDDDTTMYYFCIGNILYHIKNSLASWVACSLIVHVTWVQSQVTSYQRLKKWSLIPPCLTLSIIRYVSRVKWSNPGKE